MSINNLPSAIQSVIQQGYLERRFRDALQAKLGYRAIADREPFMANIGESITKTRVGLLPAVTTPIATPANTDITSGLTPGSYSVEQYILSVNQFAFNLMLNVATSQVAIDSLFLRNAFNLGEQALRSVDTLAQLALYNAYMGGNTRVTTTLGAAGTTVKVDDVRGFQQTLNAQGQPVAVSSSNPVTVVVNATGYSLTGVTLDGSNISTAPGGISGSLVFSANVAIVDGTAGNSVVSSVAPAIIRPSLSSTGVMATNTSQISSANDINNGKLTIAMLLAAKANLESNNVPHVSGSDVYHAYVDPTHMTGLYADPAFQSFFRGKPDTAEYRRGAIAELLGMSIIVTNMNPVQVIANSPPIRRASVVGQGALVEGVFTRTAYAAANGVDDGNLTTVVDDIAHVTREPLDALKQVVTQTWSYIGGFVAPTDTTANPSVLPTATNSAYKRAVIVESF